MRFCTVVLFSTLALSACKPPASDEYHGRGEAADQRAGPSAPIASPDATDAFWADSAQGDRIIYGQPGKAPYLALSCEESASSAAIHVTRFTQADREAQALMALIGNGHMARLPVDATFNGTVWLWEGRYNTADTDLDVLTGPRQVELTIPGAGSVMINPSDRPAQLIGECRRSAAMGAAPK